MFEISYANLVLMLASIPDYKKKDEDEFFQDIESENDFMQFFNYN